MANEFRRVMTRDSKADKQDIEQLCEKLSPGTVMVEVGSYAGDSACLFLQSGKVSKIYCVDPWEGDYDGNDYCSYACPMKVVEGVFDKQMAKFSGLGLTVNKLKMTSIEAASRFEDHSLDLCYVDACHLYESAKEDYLTWIRKVKEGGWIAGHDFGLPMFPGVQKAVLEVIGKPQFLFCAGSWMTQIQEQRG